MIRFTNGLFCHVFRMEIALVLHHASIWGEMSNIPVDINALADKTHGDNSLHAWDLAVDLDTDKDVSAHLAQLHGYLARNLSPEYDVVLEVDHVHVEWDAHRKPALVVPNYGAPPKPPA